MPFNVSQFKSEIGSNGGFLKNNRYMVVLTVPKIMQGKSIDGAPSPRGSTIKNSSDANRSLQYYAERANLPGITLMTADVRRQGVGNLEKTAFGAVLNDVDITFNIDQRAYAWGYFNEWMNSIYDFNLEGNTEFELEYKDNYVCNISVFVYNEITPKAPAIVIDLFDAYPVSMSDVGMEWGSNGVLAKLNVRFSYLSWSKRKQ